MCAEPRLAAEPGCSPACGMTEASPSLPDSRSPRPMPTPSSTRSSPSGSCGRPTTIYSLDLSSPPRIEQIDPTTVDVIVEEQPGSRLWKGLLVDLTRDPTSQESAALTGFWDLVTGQPHPASLHPHDSPTTPSNSLALTTTWPSTSFYITIPGWSIRVYLLPIWGRPLTQIAIVPAGWHSCNRAPRGSGRRPTVGRRWLGSDFCRSVTCPAEETNPRVNARLCTGLQQRKRHGDSANVGASGGP